MSFIRLISFIVYDIIRKYKEIHIEGLKNFFWPFCLIYYLFNIFFRRDTYKCIKSVV